MSGEGNEFCVHVHSGCNVCNAVVHPLDCLKDLINQCPDLPNNSILIHNNVVLSAAFSFAFYGITEGAHIFAMKVENKLNQIHNQVKERIKLKAEPLIQKMDKEEFRKIFIKARGMADDEIISQSYNSIFNPIVAQEAARIKDRFFERVEGTLKCHRKLISNFRKITQNS